MRASQQILKLSKSICVFSNENIYKSEFRSLTQKITMTVTIDFLTIKLVWVQITFTFLLQLDWKIIESNSKLEYKTNINMVQKFDWYSFVLAKQRGFVTLELCSQLLWCFCALIACDDRNKARLLGLRSIKEMVNTGQGHELHLQMS